MNKEEKLIIEDLVPQTVKEFLSDENVSCHYGFIRISYDSENCVIKSECAF